MNKRNKKSLIALLILVIVGVIGFTLAYFSDSITIGNKFKTKEYGTSVTEEFVSPDNWTPGTTTEKSVVATNTGNVDEAVRISYTEKWVAADGTELSGWVNKDGKLTDHADELATDERAAIINFDNESDWTLSNGYYYYNYKLSSNEETSSLIKSVTFNSLVTSDSNCETEGNTTTCTSTKKGYDGATYTLTFIIETVQYNKYKEAWNIGNTITIASTSRPLETLAQHIIRKSNDVTVSNYTDGITTEAYTFIHESTEQTPELTDYRYIGSNPNNYVKFNCDNDGNNCEVCRIIGVFSVDDGTGNYQQRVKLIRGSSLGTLMSWDVTNHNFDWTNASLKTFLNRNFYNQTGDAADYGLKESARNMIEDAKFYLGTGSSYYSAEDLYALERGKNSYNNISIKWTGKVGLMYPSGAAV